MERTTSGRIDRRELRGTVAEFSPKLFFFSFSLTTIRALERGTHPHGFDGLIMRRIEDEKRLRPISTEPPLEVTIWTDRGWNLVFDSVRELVDFLGDRLKRSSVYWVLDRPGHPLPPEWGLAAIRTRRGWHFRAAELTQKRVNRCGDMAKS